MGHLVRFRDDLTYKDLAGRRRPRRYVLAALGILILLCGIAAWGRQLRQDVLALGPVLPGGAILGEGSLEALSTPAAGRAVLVEALPLLTISAARDPLSRATISSVTPTPEACPQDPAEWELLEISQADNFKRIALPCVYDGLARTVAWDLLRALGYSAPESAEMLGFEAFPRRPVPEILGMTDTRGPMDIELEYAGGGVVNSDLRTWIVDQGGNPGLTFTLRGCYRAESWDVAYPVVCVVSVDHLNWAVLELGDRHYTFELNPLRQFALYGYAGEGQWVGLGYQKEPIVQIRLPGSISSPILSPALDLEQIMVDQRFSSTLHGVVPWDGTWLGATFGLTMRPLPEGWLGFDDPAELQAIQAEAGPVIERKEIP
jgi:hypothetical protein